VKPQEDPANEGNMTTAREHRSGPKYVVITPVRDEERYIENTLACVVQQTVRPAEWIIVDDGSRDGTGLIIDQYAARYHWIKALHRQDRGERLPGTGVMEAFYLGYDTISFREWEFIVKLDGDVGLSPDYFEQCFNRFEQDMKLGICGGVMFRLDNGVRRREPHPLAHVRGPIKLYKRECWEAIGGLLVSPGWDTVDEIHANYLGWRTRSFPEIEVIHYRPTGAEQGVWRDSLKNGRADYVSAYHPVFMVAKCARRLLWKPYGVAGIGQALGYVSGYLKGLPRMQDPRLIRYIRVQQMRRLVGMDNIWK